MLLFDDALQLQFKDTSVLEYSPVQYGFRCLMDKNQVLWLGYNEGLSAIEIGPRKFRQFLARAERPFFSCRGIRQIGDTLLINSNEPTMLIDLKSGKTKALDWHQQERGNRSIKFLPFITANDGSHWTASERLYRVSAAGTIMEELIVKEDSFKNIKRIWSFFQDQNDAWWVGVGTGFLYRVSPPPAQKSTRFSAYNEFTDLQDAIIWQFLEDEKGIWIAAQNGLYLLDPEKGIIAHYGIQQEGKFYLPAEEFYYIHKDTRDQTYWLATHDGGLLHFSPEADITYRQFSRSQGLPSNELYTIIEDAKGQFWISSAKGLIQLNPETLRFNIYFEEQGITNNEFNRLSYHQTPDGTIYFGGLNGVTSFHPNDFQEIEQEFPIRLSAVHLTREQADGPEDITESVLQGQPIRFYPHDKLLAIDLSMQDYFHADQITYSYQIRSGGRDRKQAWTALDNNS
ncbi:MAG: hypothetical protein KDC44_18875, partial [Phaeodactylibacter sp.]|nr:hypothetical protein [Phaeodactylibacter sp.]